jgi:hypothetical protein
MQLYTKGNPLSLVINQGCREEPDVRHPDALASIPLLNSEIMTREIQAREQEGENQDRQESSVEQKRNATPSNNNTHPPLGPSSLQNKGA